MRLVNEFLIIDITESQFFGLKDLTPEVTELIRKNISIDGESKNIYINESILPLPLVFLYSICCEIFDDPDFMTYSFPFIAQKTMAGLDCNRIQLTNGWKLDRAIVGLYKKFTKRDGEWKVKRPYGKDSQIGYNPTVFYGDFVALNDPLEDTEEDVDEDRGGLNFL